MGPVLCEVFAEQGADVVAVTRAPADVDAPATAVAAAGVIDVLLAKLALPAPSTPAVDVSGRVAVDVRRPG